MQKETFMKKAKSGLWMFGLFLVLGLVIGGCKKPADSDSSGGSHQEETPSYRQCYYQKQQ